MWSRSSYLISLIFRFSIRNKAEGLAWGLTTLAVWMPLAQRLEWSRHWTNILSPPLFLPFSRSRDRGDRHGLGSSALSQMILPVLTRLTFLIGSGILLIHWSLILRCAINLFWFVQNQANWEHIFIYYYFVVIQWKGLILSHQKSSEQLSCWTMKVN